MQKFALLVSALVLAACGGSITSGGGSSVREAVTQDAIDSNGGLTSVAAALYISRDKARTVLARSGSSIIINGKEYDVYLSDNVKLHTAPLTDAYNNIDAGANLEFEVDSHGEIKKITLSGVEQYVHPNPNYIEGGSENKYINGWTASRETKTNNFTANNIAFVGDDEEIKIQSMTLGYESLGKNYKDQKKLNLKYSDFGHIDFLNGVADSGEELDGEEQHYFAGGYKIVKVEPDKVDKDMTFDGVVNANVRVHKSYIEGYTGPGQKDLTDEDAKLVFNPSDKTSTLNMKFDDWYDVKANMDSNGKLAGLLFIKNVYDEDGNIVSAKDIDNRYRFRYELDPVTGSTDVDGNYIGQAQKEYDPENPSDEYAKASVINSGFVEYYGENGNPSEAVGVIRYAEENGGEQIGETYNHARIDFVAGFGATKQN